MTTLSLSLKLLKLRYWDDHVHAVPAGGLDGAPFAGPGVDLRGEDAQAVFVRSQSLLTGLEAIEPGIKVRALSLDFVRPRITGTFEPLDGCKVQARSPKERPRVVRLDAPGIVEPLFVRAEDSIALAGQFAHRALTRRAQHSVPVQ